MTHHSLKTINGIIGLTRIFCRMKVATVFESSEPASMIRRQSGIISVVNRKFITS